MSPPREEESDQVGDLAFAPPPMKHSDTRDSISSIDSDISLTFESSGESPAASAADEGAHLADQSDCGSDTGKDSGCEAPADPPFTPPDEELAARIVAQVEFYFSDVNISKDAFLLKHVRRNKEGFVSLKLISSFKRVKHLAKDWRVVAAALARSTKLQINDAGTKLRRLAPLPAYDETTPSRTVVAAPLPHDRPTIESVAQLFACHGDVALVRILRPGNPVPADARAFLARRPELTGVVCALVEFATAEVAQRALQAPERPGIRVMALDAPVAATATPPERLKKRSLPAKKTALARFFDSEYSSSCPSGSEAETEPRPRGRRVSTPNWMQRRLAYNRDSGSESSSSSLYGRSRCNSGASDVVRSRCNSGASDAVRSWCNSSAASDSRSRCNSGASDIVRSRCNSGACDLHRPRSNSGATHLPDNVVRLPRGPDGSRGFHASHRQLLTC
ncbi:la-related protein 6 [Periplaneta americana]|uniref:la-related protein 6 n=1 Tax=Periplaneta americana TaxID=6978 RepID=UPI0037E8854B